MTAPQPTKHTAQHAAKAIHLCRHRVITCSIRSTFKFDMGDEVPIASRASLLCCFSHIRPQLPAGFRYSEIPLRDNQDVPRLDVNILADVAVPYQGVQLYPIRLLLPIDLSNQ